MTIRLTARAAGIDEDHEIEVLTAGVGEAEDGTGWVLLFQCSLDEPDEQDVALSQDTYCVVTADQGTAYGGVREVGLRDGVLRVVMAPENLEPLGMEDPEIEFTLDVAPKAIAQLRDGLQRVLAYGRADARPDMAGL